MAGGSIGLYEVGCLPSVNTLEYSKLVLGSFQRSWGHAWNLKVCRTMAMLRVELESPLRRPTHTIFPPLPWLPVLFQRAKRPDFQARGVGKELPLSRRSQT